MTTRVQMIIDTLKENPDQRFTARELAIKFIERYPHEIAEKKGNPRYKTEEDLIAQLSAEIGGERTVRAKRQCPNIATQDNPRPRVYYWQNSPNNSHTIECDEDEEREDMEILLGSNSEVLTERDLYPMLISYLSEDYGLNCLRIDERRSRNVRGSGGNHWLHPDIVALETLDKGWNSVVRDCVRSSNDAFFRLWSFEVKKVLNKSNVRKSFFQAVSNSSWASFAYLVTANLDSDVESELQMLSGLHNVGIILLNKQSLFDSQVLIPAKEKNNIDWLSVNRIVEENQDFKAFIDQVGIYSQTGRLTQSLWNK